MRRAVAIGLIGVGVPVLVGALLGQTQLGLGIGLGAMLLGGGSRAADDPLESIALSVGAVIDFGRPWHDALLVDRLIATLAGSAIVLLANLAMDGVLAREARAAPG